MTKRRVLSLVLALAMIISVFAGMTVVSATQAYEQTEDGDVIYNSQDAIVTAADTVTVDFTTMSTVPVYSAENGQGFVDVSGAIMAEGYDRHVASTSSITVSENGASVTESNGDYLTSGKYLKSTTYPNYGGLIYRFDTEPGAYRLEVTLGGDSTSSNTKIAPTGLNATNLTGTSNWDNANHVPRTVSAVWNEKTWTYDFATGQSFVELDIEPTTLPTESSPQTVTVKSIKITPIAVGEKGDKPTIHILGDSTQKTYTFDETISSWGQTLKNYYDLSKVNVINYSMGGRCMRNNYCEGRFDEVLIRGKAGDFVFIHSAHNDESAAESRFDRGTNYTGGTKDQNNALYNEWLDMYVDAIKARGMTPVLVSPMTRGGGQAYTFNPNSPENMRAKAKSDSEVGYVELYQGSIDYYKKLDKNEGTWTYNNIEAGETPASNSANGSSGDGTHYRESAAKQFCRIIQQSIYDQSVAETDTYNDKAIMQKLVSYMPENVQTAAKTGDWSDVFPEVCKDVSAVDVIPGATKQAQDNYYYRTSIEKALQIGALHKNASGEFKPTQTITVGEFAKGMEKVFGLAENSLTNYTKTYAQLLAEGADEAAVDAAAYEVVATADESVEDVAAAADGVTVTVKQPVGGTITIYNESSLKAKTYNVKSGVTANQVLDDNEYFKLTAPAEIKEKTNKEAVFSDNKEITTSGFEIRNSNPEKIVIYEAKADGKIKAYVSAAANKPIELVGETTQSANVSGVGIVEFNVEAGKTYKLWTRGGTGQFFGIKYESTDYPQSTESLVVNSGDNVKIVAVPNKGYLNNTITVNGNSVATGGSYIMSPTENTVVSATFKSEPAFVEETKIASDAALTREAMGAILYDAYQEFQKNGDETAKTYMAKYMSQNGSVPTPDDPNYDPNIKYEGTPYIPLTGWGALSDIETIDNSLYVKVKEAYNLGLIRTEEGISRGTTSNGTKLQPKTEVTRAKAAKSLVFCFILTQLPSEESQMIPNNENLAYNTAEIAEVNSQAPSVPFSVATKYDYQITKAVFDTNGSLNVELSYSGTEAEPKAKLVVASYDKNDESVMTNSAVFDVEGTAVKDLFFTKPENNDTVKVYLWNGTDSISPLAESVVAGIATPEPSATPTAPPTATPAPTPKPSPKAAVVNAAGETVGEYDTINKALAKAKELNPQSEAQRVTINVDPTDYEEQVRIDNMKFLTIQQTPGTTGRVNLSWYFCTGYCTSNTDLNGVYDPTIDWSRDETWNGYNEGDEKFTRYEIGQSLSGVSTISYYDINGVAHKNVAVNGSLGNLGGLGWSYDKMAALIVTKSSSDITVKDLNIVNSVPVMKIAAEIDGHLTPEEGRTDLFDHSCLSICSEDTPMVKPSEKIYTSSGAVDKTKLKALIDKGHVFTPEESAWLIKSSAFNERGHALATLGDRIIFENVRARGNQDSIWASDGRAYFKNCTLIGGTDYIYGSAAAVFDNCKLGFAGFTDQTYGNPLGTPNTDAKRNYGYLFWNCTIYNECDNGGESNFGGPWGADGQSTFYNTIIDDAGIIGNSKVKIAAKGWGRFGAENGLARLYEYGTTNTSGKAVDFSKRIVNKSIEEGGTGMGTVLDEWQILEFNPRNYFSRANDSTWKDDWDPMNYTERYAKVDAAVKGATIVIPESEETTFDLPLAPEGISFLWKSSSSNAIVSEDGTKITVIRPAAGEDSITSSVILYAMDNETKLGDKKEISVTITPTTDTTNVFNIPVTVTQSVAGANDYTITLTKEGAMIKSQVVSVEDGQATATATIENIPASADGIEYSLSVVSKSDEYGVTSPTDGKMTVSGKIGVDVPLNIVAQKAVDKTVDLDITTTAANGNKTYDIISLARKNGAGDDILTSDSIVVEFDFDITEKPSQASYIDISSGKPSNESKAVAQRFTAVKVNPSWVQLDTVDCSQGWSGSSNGDGQCLNITGKFDYSTVHHVKAIIDYKASTVTVDGSSSGSGKTKTPYTFTSFPKDAQKGTVNMGVFVGSKNDKYTISNVSVTYKHIMTGDEPEETPVVIPEGSGQYNFADVIGGNQCDDSETFVFLSGVDAKVKALFADSSDDTKMNTEYTKHYKNYVAGTASNGSNPTITLKAPAGKYRIYYVGYNHGNNITATVNNKTFTASSGIDLASRSSDSSYVLKYYTIDIEMEKANSMITFDSSEQWLPDTYTVAVLGSSEL